MFNKNKSRKNKSKKSKLHFNYIGHNDISNDSKPINNNKLHVINGKDGQSFINIENTIEFSKEIDNNLKNYKIDFNDINENKKLYTNSEEQEENNNIDYDELNKIPNKELEKQSNQKLNQNVNNELNEDSKQTTLIEKTKFNNKNKSLKKKSMKNTSSFRVNNLFKFNKITSKPQKKNSSYDKKPEHKENKPNEERIIYSDQSNILSKSNKNKFFCFIISSYNNEKNISKNLLSVINQNYNNWRAIYINDNSNDKTDELFFKIIKLHDVEDKFTYIKNDKQMKQAYNKYIAYQKLKDFEICCILDGDDWLISNDCLSILNDYYNKTNNLIICSNYKRFNNNKFTENKHHDYSREIKINSNYRYSKQWFFTHLKTGYGFLFKSIPESYFKLEDKWLDRCTDWAEMFSAAEFAKEKVVILKNYLYGYNFDNSQKYDTCYNKDKNSEERKNIEKHILNFPKCKYSLPKCFIINLLKEKFLQKQIVSQMKYLNFSDFNFFEAIDGYKNHQVLNLHNKYLQNFNSIQKNSIINPHKKHCSLGALGLIASTLTLFNYIEYTFPDLDHVTILEDDFYCLKKFHENLLINEKVLIDKDFVYLGTHNPDITNIYNNIPMLDNNNLDVKNSIFMDINENKILYYGTYSYICSKKFRKYVLNCGIDYFINKNLSLDVAYNYFRIKTDLSFYLYSKQLFIPEVRKKGIQAIRHINFYKERDINLNNYLI